MSKSNEQGSRASKKKGPEICRTYQGRALRVWIKMGGEWVLAKEGPELIWRHHELFQSAVNYYLVALASLSADDETPIARMKNQMQGYWNDFRRAGELREGMRRTLKNFIGDHDTLDRAHDKILEGSEVTSEVRRRSLDHLLKQLGGDGTIQKSGMTYLSRFCNPDYKGSFDDKKYARDMERCQLAEMIRSPGADPTMISHVKLELFAEPTKDGRLIEGEELKELLMTSLDFVASEDNGISNIRGRLAAEIATLPETTRVRAYNDVNKATLRSRLCRFLLASVLSPSVETFESLRRSIGKPKKPEVVVESGHDPIERARGSRKFVFPAFTSLECWKKSGPLAWMGFDITAFQEALKTINQVRTKQEERDSQKKKCEAQLRWIRDGHGDPAKVFSRSEDDDLPDRYPGTLAGDPRADRLKNILEEDLAVKNELTDGDSIGYFLRGRTLRKYDELIETWQKQLNKNPSTTVSDLIQICDKMQGKHRDDVGSVVFFRALARRENWMIWREPDVSHDEKKRSRNVVRDYALKLALERQIEHLSDPIRFSPANASQSRRLYAPADCEHVMHESQHCVEFSLAKQTCDSWDKIKVRVAYSAPRLRRDQLYSNHWLPPVLAQFGAEPPESENDTVTFGDTAIHLMPDHKNGNLRVLVNFEPRIDVNPVRKKLGISDWWGARQFNRIGTKTESKLLHLLWPESSLLSERKGEKPDWWEHHAPWSALGVDLGQHTAAAYARLDVTPGPSIAPKNGWDLGEAGGLRWHARLGHLALLRLPGENSSTPLAVDSAHEGRRGRRATPEESADAAAILSETPSHGLMMRAGELDRLSFPEQNDILLKAARRSQGWFRRLHRWRWMLTTPERRAVALDEVRTNESWHELRPDVTGDADVLLPLLDEEIALCRVRLPRLLLRLTNRILPLRHRSWEWVPGEDGYHVLRSKQRAVLPGRLWIRGQRGLSLRRIEQLENLRTRWQSLNKTLSRKVGDPPPSGRRLRDSLIPDPCPEILTKLDRLKRQRVNQTANLIVAEALGVELDRHRLPTAERHLDDRHGEYRKVREPVACVVMEDLSSYHTSQDRAPSKNSRLMKWCHRAVLSKVKMMCEPLGIAVLEVGAAYSSRFSSRTGVAGFRASEVTLADRDSFPWCKHVTRTEEKGKKSTSADRAVAEVFEMLRRAEVGREGKKPRTLVLPRLGGPLFVPMRDHQDHHGIQQADLNAAVNLCLRGIASPMTDRLRPCVHLETEKQDGHAKCWLTRRYNLNEKARWEQPTEAIGLPELESSYQTVFRDLGDVASFGTASLGGQRIATGEGLWGSVKQQCWDRVMEINRARVRAWRLETDSSQTAGPRSHRAPPAEDDISF